ncbi:MAG: efflux RND transporter periplasmic adaptor subunit [Bacteroidetes bacterium]|nr:efflux RND transporter periplasmic adaptor subunit [Bacteroidota bacterium]
MKRVLVLSSLLILLFNSSCESKKEEEQPDVYTVTSPVRMDTSTTQEWVCQIRAIQHIELRALESGYLEHIYVDEGQYVEKGQIMFQLLPISYKAEYQKAMAEANYARIEYENARILSDSNVISPVQLALVEAEYEKAKAELELARVHMQFTEIRAPFSGLMDRFQVRLGSLLSEGDLLTTLSDISTLWVYFNVPEAQYLEYKRNMRKDSIMEVKLRMADGQIYNHIGYVRTIEADFDNRTGNIAFRATFDNPQQLLRHGETGSVIIDVPLKNSVVIPQKATFEVLDKKFVYVVDENDVIHARKITIDAEIPDLFIVKDGIDEHDKIVLEGLRKVRDNEKIVYEFENPKEVISHLKLHAE